MNPPNFLRSEHFELRTPQPYEITGVFLSSDYPESCETAIYCRVTNDHTCHSIRNSKPSPAPCMELINVCCPVLVCAINSC